ncbi:hypothetical protein XNC3_1960050 [Xenorhabdus nematophila F1]|nr:hypothetical protein XNC3_1960050 [Xenorhabdus nematophila F1]CEF33696.1 hypothetical protein XNW1_4890006 [Xenorhabdus nematophila str. Websteri]
MDYRYGSHMLFQIEYHFVWVTKYRYKVLTSKVAIRGWELVCQTCETFEIRILKGVVSQDHVHILGSAFLGQRLFLCHGRSINGRNDKGLSGASF